MIPMQLCFDVFYDDAIEEALIEHHINQHIAQFIVMIPEIFLILDTLLKFITGFYEDGVIVVDKKEIVKHYLKKGLIFDIFSYFPVITQGVLRKSYPTLFDEHEITIKYLQLMLFFKLKRVTIAINNFEEIISSKGGHDFILSAFRLLYVIFFVTHMNACIWHAVGYFNPEAESVNTWLKQSGIVNEHWLVKYLTCMYWSISTFATIGFDHKISPQNNLEMLAGVFILVVSVLIFAFSINSMKQILDMMSKEEKEYK